MSSKKDTKKFIKDAIDVHGDRYDYSKTNYTLSKCKITITCKKHGDFIQEANSHLMGHGCKMCKVEKNKKPDHLKWDRKSYMKEYSKKYREINKEVLKIKEKERIESKRANRRKYYHNRKNDMLFRIKQNLRKRLWKCLKTSIKKHDSKPKTIEMLGCEIKYFKEYIESKFKKGMTWDNYGKWHIDHIIPCAHFDFSDISQIKKCFHYTNLQPLWASENCSKGSKILKNNLSIFSNLIQQYPYLKN